MHGLETDPVAFYSGHSVEESTGNEKAFQMIHIFVHYFMLLVFMQNSTNAK